MPKVRYYLMGKNEWRTSEAWPLLDTEFTPYYFCSKGNANSLAKDGVLSTKLKEEGATDSFTYDPGNPVPSTGGAPFSMAHFTAGTGSVDQRSVEARNDVLVYSTSPFDKGVTVTGPIKIKLYVSSSVTDTDFTAKLVDVYPDGRAYNLMDSILRTRYREGLLKNVRMSPGEVYELTIDLQATANYFAPGHCIRLEISSSNFPNYERNLNTGGNNYDEKEWIIAENTIHHSRKYPSHILLPIIKE